MDLFHPRSRVEQWFDLGLSSHIIWLSCNRWHMRWLEFSTLIPYQSGINMEISHTCIYVITVWYHAARTDDVRYHSTDSSLRSTGLGVHVSIFISHLTPLIMLSNVKWAWKSAASRRGDFLVLPFWYCRSLSVHKLLDHEMVLCSEKDSLN